MQRTEMIAVSGWQEATELPVLDFISNIYTAKVFDKLFQPTSVAMECCPVRAFDLYSEIMKIYLKLKLLPAAELQPWKTY
jgi:phosphoribosylformimino-5-aminoimidazole carboxamide ribotide isomerase